MYKLIKILFVPLLFLVSCSYSDFTTYTLRDDDNCTNYYFFQRSDINSSNNRLIIFLDGGSFNSVLGKKGSILPWKSFSIVYDLQNDLSDNFNLLVPEKMNIETGEDFSQDSVKLSYITLNSRVLSSVNVIDKFLNDNIYEYVYLVGYSEGGMILPRVYNNLKNKNMINKLVSLSGGGYSYYNLIKFMYKENDWDTTKIDSALIEIENNPNSLSKFYLGHPYKQWVDFINYEPALEYKNIDIPILLLHGTDDKNGTVESSRYLKNRFDEWDKSNLTYYELENMDHRYNGDFPEVLKIVEDWLVK